MTKKAVKKKTWTEQKTPDDLPGDPVEYLCTLSNIELFGLAEALDGSKHWCPLCWRVHRWTLGNGHGCGHAQTELWARNILLKYISKGFVADGGGISVWKCYSRVKMRDLGYKPYKPKKNA